LKKFPEPSPVITYRPGDISVPTLKVPEYKVVAVADELSLVGKLLLAAGVGDAESFVL
jgi:hypothetical protein